jgi:hypothetical protein
MKMIGGNVGDDEDKVGRKGRLFIQEHMAGHIPLRKREELSTLRTQENVLYGMSGSFIEVFAARTSSLKMILRLSDRVTNFL